MVNYETRTREAADHSSQLSFFVRSRQRMVVDSETSVAYIRFFERGLMLLRRITKEA
jgi:hypothetical protein